MSKKSSTVFEIVVRAERDPSNENKLIEFSTTGFVIDDGEKFEMGSIDILGLLQFAEHQVLTENLEKAQQTAASIAADNRKAEAKYYADLVIEQQESKIKEYSELGFWRKLVRRKPKRANGWEIYVDHLERLESKA